MYSPAAAHLHAVGQTTLRTNMHRTVLQYQSSIALCMYFMSQSSAAAVLLLPKLGALVALTIFMKASWTLSYSSTAW